MTDAILDESGANLVVVAGALIEQQPINALTAYAPGNIRTLLGAIRTKVLAEAEGLDASTPKRRDALKSLAAKVARTKTTLDGLRAMHKRALNHEAQLAEAAREEACTAGPA